MVNTQGVLRYIPKIGYGVHRNGAIVYTILTFKARFDRTKQGLIKIISRLI